MGVTFLLEQAGRPRYSSSKTTSVPASTMQAPLPSWSCICRGRRCHRPDMVWPPGWRGEATTERSATASACARWCCHSSPRRACGTCSRVVEGMRERRRVAAWRATGHLARVYKVQAVREDRVLLRSHSHHPMASAVMELRCCCARAVQGYLTCPAPRKGRPFSHVVRSDRSHLECLQANSTAA